MLTRVGIVGNPDFLDTFDHPAPALEGIIVSVYNLGCFTGCILAFLFCEKTGRRVAMWIAMVWIIVGAILQTTAYSVPHMMVARFITGIGTGIETSTVPMYQSELCEADKRGRLVSSEPLFVGVGIEIAVNQPTHSTHNMVNGDTFYCLGSTLDFVSPLAASLGFCFLLAR